MCGIVGYLGNRKSSSILLDGLKKLEYRGYDSCGMSIGNEKSIETRKDVGKINDVDNKHNFSSMEGSIGIAHTRWATHGGVTKENSHPHISNNGLISVVHNGIIENHNKLRHFLMENGFEFSSDTDTEIIPNLIQHEMSNGNDFITAYKNTIKSIKGRYAILAMNNEGGIVASRNGSPLVLGIGEDEYFLASDIPSFMNHTKKIVYLKDNDMVYFQDGNHRIFNLDIGKEESREIDSIDWDVEKAEKGEFDHFMLKEITEQADTIQEAINQDENLLDEICRKISNSKDIFLVGCGTSYHASLSGSYVMSKIAGQKTSVILASEFPHYKHFLNPDSLIIAVSQSGETADVLDSIKISKEMGAQVISIVNVKGSSIHRESDYSLMMNSGPEICVLSTKSYTSQLAIFTLLAYKLVNSTEEGKSKLKSLYNDIYNLTSKNMRDYLQNIANYLVDKNHIFTIGKGILYPTALEAALKIKEVSYIHTEGFAGGELKHGPIALIEKGTPCIAFDNDSEIISNATEIKSRGGVIIGIGPKNNDIFDYYIKVPDADVYNPILQAIPAQILAYQLAVLKNLDPDKPRNLAKSVTVR